MADCNGAPWPCGLLSRDAHREMMRREISVKLRLFVALLLGLFVLTGCGGVSSTPSSGSNGSSGGGGTGGTGGGTGGGQNNACSGMSAGQGGSLNGFRPFTANNLWNQDISTAPIDPNSDAIISFIGSGIGLHPDFGAGQYSGSNIGIPYVVVNSSQASVPINFTAYGDESDPG